MRKEKKHRKKGRRARVACARAIGDMQTNRGAVTRFLLTPIVRSLLKSHQFPLPMLFLYEQTLYAHRALPNHNTSRCAAVEVGRGTEARLHTTAGHHIVRTYALDS